MTTKRKITIALAVAAALAFCAYVGFEYYKEKVRDSFISYEILGTYSGNLTLKSYDNLDDNALAVQWEIATNPIEYDIFTELLSEDDREHFSIAVSQNYLVRENAKVKFYGYSYVGYSGARSDEEYWTVDIYNLNDLSQAPLTVNVFEEIDGDDYTSSLNNRTYYNDGGNEYIAFVLYRQDNTSYYKLVNLSNGEVTEVERDISVNTNISGYQIYTSASSSLLNGTSIQEALEAQGLSVTADLSETTVSVQSDGELTSASQQWQLYNQYQSAYEILKSGGSIYLTSSDLDEILDVFELFFENSDILYEGLTVYADYSTDGQEHTVNSYDEFVQYFKTSTDEEAS